MLANGCPAGCRLNRELPRKLVIAAALVFGLAAAPAASADTAQSSNWSGYVVHRAGVSFRSVQATWTQPSATCETGQSGYSAFWIGLGGYASDSQALEQIGTELDCNPQGHTISTAWYELVPSPSQSTRLTVRPGDQMNATVSVRNSKVTLRLNNLTRHRSFVKTVARSTIDLGSAEWIAEAPSACASSNFCRVLPLTDFGSVTFTDARAMTVANRSGSISSPSWSPTKIILSAATAPFLVSTGAATESTPSALRDKGRTFDVRYSQSTISSTARASQDRTPLGPSSRLQPGGARR